MSTIIKQEITDVPGVSLEIRREVLSDPSRYRDFDVTTMYYPSSGTPGMLLTWDDGTQVSMSIEGVMQLAEYAMRNFDIRDGDDPRFAFLNLMKMMHIGPGFNKNTTRFKA